MVAVAESRLTRDDIDGMSALFHELPRSLDPEIFDRFRWRLTRFGVERPAELSGAEMSHIRKLRNGQRLVKILPSVGKCRLDAI